MHTDTNASTPEQDIGSNLPLADLQARLQRAHADDPIISPDRNFMASRPVPIPAATWGVMHGSGFLGDAIRWVEQAESKSEQFPNGDTVAAWAGHVVVATGAGTIIQAEWPRVTENPEPPEGHVVWALNQPLTPEQRTLGLLKARSLVGTEYDVTAYAYYLARLADIPITHDYTALAEAEAKAGPICSGLAMRCQETMKVNLGPLTKIADNDPDWISPANMFRWGLRQGWMVLTPPPVPPLPMPSGPGMTPDPDVPSPIDLQLRNPS